MKLPMQVAAVERKVDPNGAVSDATTVGQSGILSRILLNPDLLVPFRPFG